MWMIVLIPDPPENCHLTVKKNCQKLDIFSKKNAKIFLFFSKKLPLAIFLKKKNLGQFFLKKCQVFGNFLTVKWQFSGGSGMRWYLQHQLIWWDSPRFHWERRAGYSVVLWCHFLSLSGLQQTAQSWTHEHWHGWLKRNGSFSLYKSPEKSWQLTSR